MPFEEEQMLLNNGFCPTSYNSQEQKDERESYSSINNSSVRLMLTKQKSTVKLAILPAN